MHLPSGILKNTEAALALLALCMGAVGLLLCTAGYFSFFFFLQNLDAAVVPQIDSTVNALSNLQPAVASVSESAETASAAIGPLSGALASYSASSGEVSDTLTSLSMVPPFSLDKRVPASATKLREASRLFSNASQILNSSATSAISAALSIKKTSEDLDSARQSLLGAKAGFKSAVGMLQIGALAAYLALLALFSSVLLISASMLLSHYPRLFEKHLVADSRKGATYEIDLSYLEEDLSEIETDLSWLEEELNNVQKLSEQEDAPHEKTGERHAKQEERNRPSDVSRELAQEEVDWLEKR